jgi:putative heme-binding domain-containing protein
MPWATATAIPQLRRHCVRLSEAFLDESLVTNLLIELYDDPDKSVRYQAAFTLGGLRGKRRDAALAKLVASDGDDPWITFAIMSGLGSGAGGLLEVLAAEKKPTPAQQQFMGRLAAQIGKSQQADDVATLLRIVGRLSQAGEQERRRALLLVEKTEARGSLAEQLAAATGGKSEEWRAEQFKKSREAAKDSTLPLDARLAAIHRLSLGSDAEAREAAAALLAPDQSTAIHQAALGVLSRVEDETIADLLIARWPQFGPATRAAALETLLAKAASTRKLLTAMQKGKIPVSEVPGGFLIKLTVGEDETIVKAASDLLEQKFTARKELMGRYQSSLEKPGDAERGRAVFTKHCATCHQLHGVGHEIGPNLISAATRGAESILVNVLDPNQEVNPQFINYVAVTKDGRTASGILSAETANSITLLRGEKASDTLLRIDLEELKSTGTSLMPEGLEKEIDPAAMADLLTYLLQADLPK